MKLSFHGGAKVVTGANHILETKTTRIMVDCGMFQGGHEQKGWNERPFDYDPKAIDAVILTHAHLDHSGRIPLLVKQGFRGPIFATPPTCELANVILDDSQDLMAGRQHIGARHATLYSAHDVEQVKRQWKPIPYGQRQSIGDVEFQLRNAGHILGSSMVELWAEGKKILFSGDLGNELSPLLPPADTIDQADYVVLESAYGDRVHDAVQDRKMQLERAIENAITRGGVLMIPSMAIERTQEILFDLNELVEHSRVPRVPMYVDSPLATAATQIYRKYKSYLSEGGQRQIASGDDLFQFPGLVVTRTSEDSKRINSVAAPKVIIAGNAMSTGGRIIFHEQRYLPDPKNILLLVAYQVSGTNGRLLQDGSATIRIGTEQVPVRATIMRAQAYSGHADHDQLMAFVQDIQRPVEHLFAVQGEEGPATKLVTDIRDQFGINATVPSIGETVEL